MIHRIQATIDRSALSHNFRVAQQRAMGSRVVAVIKANAYGHGLLPAAEALQDADLFGVTDVLEAERLRAAGCHKDILVLQGLVTPDDLAAIIQHDCQVVIHHLDQLQWVEQALDQKPPARPLTIWLKLDTGMGRLGLFPTTYASAWRKLKAKPWVRDVVMMTHLANSTQQGLPLTSFRNAFMVLIGAGQAASSLTTEQFMTFAQLERELAREAPLTSIASSSGVLAHEHRGSFVRPGIMLYGSSPFAWSEREMRSEQLGLRSVMTLQGRLISIKDHKAGDNIGYSAQFTCPTPLRVGIVSVGYADGYPSNAPNGCPVAVHGIRTRTVGRVSMDMLAIDLNPVPQARLGDLVELWGANIPVDEVAAHTGILSYNLTCSVSARVPLVYV